MAGKTFRADILTSTSITGWTTRTPGAERYSIAAGRPSRRSLREYWERE